MTQRARAQEGLDLRRGGISISPLAPTTMPTRDLLDHERTRYNTRAWGDALTGRFCSVHHWPVFNCPPRVSAFLKAAETATDPYVRRHAVLLLLLARTGMRMGEALGLQWSDVDFGGREIRIDRAFSAGRIDTPKSGHGRTIDMSNQLTTTLLRLQLERKTETLKHGWAEMPEWVFCTEIGTPLDESRVRKIFSKVLKPAGLPLHFSPHCLRHTFASLLLQQGESPAYVQRQLGHASIQLTVDTYGKWLPMGNKAAVDRLDDENGSKVVAKTATGTPNASEVPVKIGGPSRTRTLDPLIKSQLLYQLS